MLIPCETYNDMQKSQYGYCLLSIAYDKSSHAPLVSSHSQDSIGGERLVMLVV